MVHLGHGLLQKLDLIRAVSMFLLVIVFFILQYIFDMEFVCSCRPDVYKYFVLYMVIPPVILTWVVYITEPFHRASFFSFFRCIISCNKIRFFAEFFISFLSLGALWMASVLFDGDWFICLMTNLNKNENGIPCKENLTYEENQIKAGYKTQSLDCGLYLICFLIIVWGIAGSIKTCCIRQKTWKRSLCCDNLFPPYYRKVYERLLEEQMSVHLKEELTKIARKRAEAICQPHLRTIGEDEQPPNNGGDDNDSVNNKILEAWKKISDWDFPFSSNESHVEAGTAAERSPLEQRAEEDPALEETDSGGNSSDRL